MLSKVKTLQGYQLDSIDGNVGKIREFYFDDQHWTIRYLVADTGTWLSGRQVLITPYALGAINPVAEKLEVSLTKKQIEDSPSLNTDKPVSRQFEEDYYGYYGYPMYWRGDNSWGNHSYLERDQAKWGGVNQGGKAWDPHLRSTKSVTGYHIQARDGEVGHVEDFVVDDETWAIRYLVINTHNFWPGKKVLVSPQWIERVSWSESKVFVTLTRETIKLSPEYSEEALLSREYESGLHRHYNRAGYWIVEEELAGLSR